jgi:serine/threonine protein kinase
LLSSKDADAVVKLADFGFAQECVGQNLTSILGTPAYMGTRTDEHAHVY